MQWLLREQGQTDDCKTYNLTAIASQLNICICLEENDNGYKWKNWKEVELYFFWENGILVRRCKHLHWSSWSPMIFIDVIWGGQLEVVRWQMSWVVGYKQFLDQSEFPQKIEPFSDLLSFHNYSFPNEFLSNMVDRRHNSNWIFCNFGLFHWVNPSIWFNEPQLDTVQTDNIKLLNNNRVLLELIMLILRHNFKDGYGPMETGKFQPRSIKVTINEFSLHVMLVLQDR